MSKLSNLSNKIFKIESTLGLNNDDIENNEYQNDHDQINDNDNPNIKQSNTTNQSKSKNSFVKYSDFNFKITELSNKL